MKIKDLIAKLKKCDPKDEVVVGLGYNNRFGTSPNSPIIDVYDGFDWDTGYVYLTPYKHLIIDDSKEKL